MLPEWQAGAAEAPVPHMLEERPPHHERLQPERHDGYLILSGLKLPWNSLDLINRNFLTQNVLTCGNSALDLAPREEKGLFLRQKGPPLDNTCYVQTA